MVNLQDIAPLGTTPIAGDSPTGASARYEPDYEKVQLEIEKLQSVSGEAVRWDEVVSLGSSLLSTKSKDLLLASYVTAGLLAEGGYAGLAAGLSFYKDFLTTFWDKLFPPIEKMRGREGAVRWLDERAARIVSEKPNPTESDREPLTACVAAIDALSAVLSERFTDQPIGLSELSEKLQDKLGLVPAEAAPEPAPAEGEAAPADGGAAPEASDGSAGTTQAAPASVGAIDTPARVWETVLLAVDYLKKNHVGDPLPFVLERSLQWGSMTEIPEPMPAGGDATLLPAWETALKKKDYQRVLDEAGARLAVDPLWLDLNLYTVRAMEGLGTAFENARLAVGLEVATLIRRLPELTSAVFEGGFPVATDATKQWIEHELLGGTKKAAAGTGADKVEEVMGEARKLATRGKLPAATALIQKELLTVPPGRARFLWRLNLARLCADSGKPLLAIPQLEALDEEAERGGLQLWEPELAAEVVKLLWQCYSSQSKTGGEATSGDKAAQYYARLCRLDLTSAMALDGKK